ncbi:MAG TPA: hypothetical protein V6C91_04335 [Coleofasciculaceae cyanobacterium]
MLVPVEKLSTLRWRGQLSIQLVRPQADRRSSKLHKAIPQTSSSRLLLKCQVINSTVKKMQVILSLIAIGAFCIVAAIIENLTGGRPHPENTLGDNRRLRKKRRRDLA